MAQRRILDPRIIAKAVATREEPKSTDIELGDSAATKDSPVSVEEEPQMAPEELNDAPAYANLLFKKGDRITLIVDLGYGRYLGELNSVTGVVYKKDIRLPEQGTGSKRSSRHSSRSEGDKERRDSQSGSPVEEVPQRKKSSSKSKEEGSSKRSSKRKSSTAVESPAKESPPKEEAQPGAQQGTQPAEAPSESVTAAPVQIEMAEKQQTEISSRPSFQREFDDRASVKDSTSTILSRYALNEENTDYFGFDQATTLEASYANEATWNKDTLHRRELKWVHMTQSGDAWKAFLKKNHRTIKERCIKGIPSSIRGRAWKALCGADETRAKRTGNNPTATFRSYLKPDRSEIIEVIERDLDRCYPNHVLFREVDGQGQRDLGDVLKAYTFFNEKIGYAQGMGMVAGMLLMHMPAEDTFWMMASLLEEEKYLLNFYDNQLSQTRFASGRVFPVLLEKVYPKVYAHFNKYSIQTLMFSTAWYMTVFTTTLPWASVLRVWDVFLLMGRPFLHKVALAIIEIHQKKILTLKDQSEILSFLLHEIPPESLVPNILFNAIDRVKLRSKDIEKVQKELAAMDATEAKA